MSVECCGDIDEGYLILEIMPELNLSEQSGVSQANEAMVKVIWAEKKSMEEDRET